MEEVPERVLIFELETRLAKKGDVSNLDQSGYYLKGLSWANQTNKAKFPEADFAQRDPALKRYFDEPDFGPIKSYAYINMLVGIKSDNPCLVCFWFVK